MTRPEIQRSNRTKQRDIIGLNVPLDKKLQAYTTAAGSCANSNRGWAAAAAITAVSLGVLALPQSGDAEVVFTPANLSIHGPDSFFSIDLNRDGIPDVGLSVYDFLTNVSGCIRYAASLRAYGLRLGNGIVINRSRFAVAGRAGQTAGPDDVFSNRPLMADSQGVDCLGIWSRNFYGPWLKFQGERFLGVRFRTSIGATPEFHYGWLRLKNTNQYGGTLTGYAYETIPNKPIKAGFDDNGQLIPETLPNPTPDSLGRLAAGAAAR